MSETIAEKYWRERREREALPFVGVEGAVYNALNERVCQECGGSTYHDRSGDGIYERHVVVTCVCQNDKTHVIGGDPIVEDFVTKQGHISGTRIAVSHEDKENPWEESSPESVE